MPPIFNMLKNILQTLKRKNGNEMVEASISMPLIILAILLLLRVLLFYLQILTTGIDEHIDAIEASNDYKGRLIKKYEHHAEINMLNGGLLGFNLCKSFDTEMYMFNEEFMVRFDEIFKTE